MTKQLILMLALIVAVGAGCRKNQPKPEEVPSDATAGSTENVQDTSIANQDMTFDPQGSDSGNIAGLYTINFDFDKSNLTTEGRDKAQKNAKWMKDHPDTKIQIEGHCDRSGSNEYNLALGERRAKTVKAYMVNLGIPSSRLSIISYGEEKLLDPSESEAADAKNRRANFVVLGK